MIIGGGAVSYSREMSSPWVPLHSRSVDICQSDIYVLGCVLFSLGIGILWCQ